MGHPEPAPKLSFPSVVAIPLCPSISTLNTKGPSHPFFVVPEEMNKTVRFQMLNHHSEVD